MNAVTSRDVEAADRLALAQLDDDGAPPAATWPQARGSHEPGLIRRGRTGPVAARQAGTAAAAPGEGAGQASAAPGTHSREKKNVMPEPAAPQHGSATTLPPPSAIGSAQPPPAPGWPRVSYDPALTRQGAVDGGWWPHSRNAPAELPGLIAMLDSRPGIRVQRLSVHRDEWDDIPGRLTAGDRVIRVDWFTIIPRHTVSVTAAGKEPIALLVVPPAAAEGTAQTAMNVAAASRGAGQAADILTASEPSATCQHDLGPETGL